MMWNCHLERILPKVKLGAWSKTGGLRCQSMNKQDEGDPKPRRGHKRVTFGIGVSRESVRNLEEIIDQEYLGGYGKILRVTAWVQRFISNCRGGSCNGRKLGVKELQRAENVWVKHDLQRGIGKGDKSVEFSKGV